MAKTLQEEFIDMVNAKNPDLGLTLADVNFGSPEKYVSSVEDDGRNTTLTLTAKSSSPTFKGSKAYHFHRFDFTHPNGEDVYTLATEDLMENWRDMTYALAILNKMIPNHKLNISQMLMSGSDIMTDSGGKYKDYKLRIIPEHLKWTGAVVIRVYDGRDNLMWKDGELGGFK